MVGAGDIRARLRRTGDGYVALPSAGHDGADDGETAGHGD